MDVSIPLQQAIFRPRARLLSLLGEQLISDQAVGLIELVKNAYDADATRVIIELLELARPETTRIVVRDNGSGMTREDIEQKWLSPAVNYKERQKKALQRTPLGRLPIGEKGVGRFAAQQLGHKFQLISRSAHSLEIVVHIDWDDFDKEDTFLDDIVVDLYERKPLIFTDGDTGTILIIEQARTPWTEAMVARVQRALRRLQSPHLEQDKVDFQITFRCPDFPSYENISNSDILDRAHYVFIGMVTAEGRLDYEYSCHHPALPEHSVVKDDYDLIPAARQEMFSPGKDNSGPFYLNIYVWDRSQEYLNQSGVSRADLDAMAGVSIFRDGLRVLPYGEPGNDWLDLDKERINDPSGRIGNQQIIGFVEVFQEDTQGLRDKTNREGLIDNAAFRDLRALVRATINVFTSLWIQDRPKTDRRSKPAIQVASRDALQKAKTLAEKVTETARDDIVVEARSSPLRTQAPAEHRVSAAQEVIPAEPDPVHLTLTQRQAMHQLLDHLQEAAVFQEKSEAEAEQQAQMLLHLAATGMAAERVAHEFGRQVNSALTALRVLRDLEKGDSVTAQAIRTLNACMGTLRNEFRVLAPYEAGWRLQRIVMVSVHESALLAFKLNERLINSAGIATEIQGNDFDVLARPASIVQVLDNLVHNACVWLEGWSGPRRINVTLDSVVRTLTISDTGPGVPPHLAETIFKPFFTLRNGGRGLGLYITQELLRAMHGNILLDPHQDAHGARFVLQFPALNDSGTDQGE